jgi:hypothetical protein
MSGERRDSHPGHVPLAQQRLMDEGDRAAGGHQSRLLLFDRADHGLYDAGIHDAGEVGPGAGQSGGHRPPRGLGVPASQPGQDHRMPAQHKVVAVLGRALVQQPGLGALLPVRSSPVAAPRRATRAGRSCSRQHRKRSRRGRRHRPASGGANSESTVLRQMNRYTHGSCRVTTCNVGRTVAEYKT